MKLTTSKPSSCFFVGETTSGDDASGDVFLGDGLYDFWRVKEPIAIIILPEGNVISEVFGNTVADRIHHLGALAQI